MLVYLALSLIAGALLPVQAAINARLGRAIGGPVVAAMVSAVVLAVVLGIVALLMGRNVPRGVSLAGLPWWAWTGGFGGAVILAGLTAAAPKIGAANMIALVMAGQLVASLLLDSVGAFGLPVLALGPQRLFGAALLLSGAAVLSVRF